jgi:endo-1,4-beta-xylanase
MLSKLAVPLVVAAAVLAHSGAPSHIDITPGLNTYAAKRGRYVGTATEAADINNNTAYGRAYGKIAASDEFGIYTPENNLKWEVTEPVQNQFNFTLGDQLFKIAEQKGKKMRGHTLGRRLTQTHSTPFI